MPTWHVYQLRSGTELLYVGYTRYLKRRIAEHRRTKSWWPDVTDVRSEEFATEDEARQREKELWAAERPKWNRNNPFRTSEERRDQNLTYTRAPKRLQHKRDLNKTPKYREWHREYQRRRRAARWHQEGPGLF